jgi:hypothetical protein
MGTDACLEYIIMDYRNIVEINNVSSPVAWFYLLTIKTTNNPDLCLVNNNEPIISNGIEYKPFPFSLNLPSDTGDRLPTVNLTISNISNEIIESIRNQPTAPVLTIELVSSAYPDIVEKRLDFLKLRSVSYDAMTVTGNLEVINTMSSVFPSETYDPVHYPGMYR